MVNKDVQFGMMTHFHPLRPSEGQTLILKTKIEDGRCQDMSAVDIFKTTQQGTDRYVEDAYGVHFREHD